MASAAARQLAASSASTPSCRGAVGVALDRGRRGARFRAAIRFV